MTTQTDTHTHTYTHTQIHTHSLSHTHSHRLQLLYTDSKCNLNTPTFSLSHLIYTDSKCRQQMTTFDAIQIATKTDICYHIPTSTAIQLATKRIQTSTTRPTHERESAGLIIWSHTRRHMLPLAQTATRAASRTHGDIHSLSQCASHQRSGIDCIVIRDQE